MGDFESERRALDQVLRLVSTFDVPTKRRLVALLHENIGVPPLADQNGAGGTHRFRNVREFIESKSPRTATERLTCLAYWAEAHGAEAIVPVRRLNDLNREVGGRTFSDASSVAQTAVAKGYLVRDWPGYLSLTSVGRELVAGLPVDTDAEPQTE